MDKRKASRPDTSLLRNLCGWLLDDGTRCEYAVVSDWTRCYYHAKVRDGLFDGR